MVIELAPPAGIGQILGVRWSGLACCLVASAALAAPRSSNPAFLGIRMQDAGGRGPCTVEGVTHGSPAEAAGLRTGDLVLWIDGTPIPTCSMLLDEITAHAPGDTIKIKVRRLNALVTASVQLTTRDALLQKVIGKPMVETNLVGLEDGTHYDLSALHGRMVILGLYNPACTDCGPLFTKLAAWARDQARGKGGPPVLVLAAVTGEPGRELQALQRTLDVPLVTGELASSEGELDGSPFSRELVISDRDRLGVIVIDGRGIVQYVGPIAPTSDDAEAVLDELFAAAEQAWLQSK